MGDEPEPVGNLFNINAPFRNPSNTATSNATKRIFKKGTHCLGCAYSNYFAPGNVISFSVSEETLSVLTSGGYGVGYAIKVTSGKTYRLECTASIVPGGSIENALIDYSFYGSDGTFIIGVQNKNNSNITIPDNVTMIVLIFRSRYSDRGEATFTGIEFEEVQGG